MKNNKYIKQHKLLIVIILTVFTFSGCNKFNDLGVGLLPPGDLLDVRNTILKEDISAYTFLEDSVITSNAPKSLLGSFNDPIFGNTTINFATQFRIQSFPQYGTNPTIDSTFLYLYYKTVYGDTTTTQKIRVYELEDPIHYDITDSTGKTSEYAYYGDVDLKKMASPQIIGQLDFIPKISLDSASSNVLVQMLKIPVDVSIAEKLVSADPSNLKNNDTFLNYFRGVFIETEKLNSGTGAIVGIETENTALVVYYNNDESRADTLPDTLNMAYRVTEFSARVNNFFHDYSSTLFYDNLNSDANEDSLIFIQAMGGLESKIKIDNLSSWKDSVVVTNGDTIEYLINKAELVFNVDTTITDIKKFPPPEQLLFTYIDTTGKQFLPKDYSFNVDYYGGTLTKDYKYRFNITQHLQQIINGEIENRDFYLTTANSNGEANRVVLKGSTSKKGIQLIVTYTKIFQ
ncbi:MAG: DUF4270 domain-containing protein [Bacteroidales bacterium]|nr:DUF4270 domain-containing protein [Bacteroidales bacterium]